MIQRQRCNDHLAGLTVDLLTVAVELLHVGVHLQHVGHQVAVGQHGPLGNTGSAAGVLQHGHVVQRAGNTARAPAVAALECCLERYRLRQRVIRDQLFNVLDRSVDQHALETGQHVPHARLKQVLDLGIRQHFLHQMPKHVHVDQRLGTRVLELVTHLPGGIERIGVDHHQSGTNRTENSNRELQHVRHLHGNTVAGLKVGVLLEITGEGG